MVCVYRYKLYLTLTSPLAGNTSPLLRGWSGVCMCVCRGEMLYAQFQLQRSRWRQWWWCCPRVWSSSVYAEQLVALVPRKLCVDAGLRNAPNTVDNVASRACITGQFILLPVTWWERYLLPINLVKPVTNIHILMLAMLRYLLDIMNSEYNAFFCLLRIYFDPNN